jgi:periplasmic protein TonB
MAAYVQDTQFFTRRTVVLFAIIGLHIFIFWALATGLAQRAIEVLAPPIQTEIVQEEQKKVDLPPPPPPEFQKPPVEVPPPDVVVDMPVEQTNSTAISNVTTKSQAPAPPPRAAVAGTPARITKPANTDDFYPSASQRLGEEGVPVVHVCLDPSGKITNVSVATSSGKPRLDEGAINVAKATRYAPKTEDGKPVEGCLDYRVKFQLH